MRRDAEAISEAVIRKTMRFVPIKTAEQQAAAMVLKTRALLVRQRTQAVNALRAHLAVLGIIGTAGAAKVEALISIVRDETDARLPAAARFALMAIADVIHASADQIDGLEHAIVVEAKRDEDMRRLITIPGIGAITAATIKALVPDPSGLLTPRSQSSGGKERLGRISKMGNPELRALLVVGANAVLRVARNDTRTRPCRPWRALLARRPFQVAAVAQVNKTARIIWALLNQGGTYRRAAPLAISAVAV